MFDDPTARIVSAGDVGGFDGPGSARSLGPLLIGEQRIVRLERDPRHAVGPVLLRDAMLLCLPIAGAAELQVGGTSRRCPAGGGLLLDLAKRWAIDGGSGLRCHTVLVPDVFLALAAPEGAAPGILEPAAELGAIRTLVGSVLSLTEPLTPREEALMVAAFRYLFAALFAPPALIDHTMALREAGLLQRAKAHVDRHLGEELSVSALCAALGCSRSALYRAAAPAGGVVELVVRSRLAAIYRCLIDPADDRPIAAIARAHGFSQAAQFSRRFRQTFGTTARQVRRVPAAPGGRSPAIGGTTDATTLQPRR